MRFSLRTQAGVSISSLLLFVAIGCGSPSVSTGGGGSSSGSGAIAAGTGAQWCGTVLAGEAFLLPGSSLGSTEKCLASVNAPVCSSGKAAKVYALYDCLVTKATSGTIGTQAYTECKQANPIDNACRDAMIGK